MGSGTDAERRAKRLYSLAYNRASGELRKRHQEEFEGLLHKEKLDLVIEETTTGGYQADGRHRRIHVEGQTSEGAPSGVCVACGRPAPCRMMRRRDG